MWSHLRDILFWFCALLNIIMIWHLIFLAELARNVDAFIVFYGLFLLYTLLIHFLFFWKGCGIINLIDKQKK